MAGRPSAVRRPSIARISSARSGRPARSSRRPAQRAVVDVAEARLGRQVVAIRVDVLAEQRDLAIAGRGERARLVDDVVERPAPLRPAAERHDAVGARLVAAVDDRQPGADRASRARRSPARPPGARAGQMVGRADDGPSDGRRRPDGRPPRSAPAPRPAPADRRARAPRPGAGTGPPPGSGAGRPARSGSRTEQPVSTTRMAGFAALSLASWPCRPMTFCSAPSRIAHVLMTTRSAASRLGASSQPAASSRPAISSESLRFIWQPSVQTWKRGRVRDSGRYSARVARRRGRPGRAGRRAGGRHELEHRQGAGQASIGRSWLCAASLRRPRPGCQRPTSGGTHRLRVGLGIRLVSPW